MKKSFPCLATLLICMNLFIVAQPILAQRNVDTSINEILPQVLKKHREFVSMPNIASDNEGILKNYEWIKKEFEKQKFNVRMLESTTLPLMLAEKTVSKKAKTILFYFHIDGQPVNAANWDQEDPFTPVLKEQAADGSWTAIDWGKLDGPINPEWRIFGRAAADDKAPIMMMLTAVELLDKANSKLGVNIKIILDPQEEAGSEAFLSTLNQYKQDYTADYMIIMDGPAHPSNQPTLTFGCRGNATCSITTYGAKLPQHSGHYGNYVPNPVFNLSHLLASMKDEEGRVLVEGYYDGLKMTAEVQALLARVPDDNEDIQRNLYISKSEEVGRNYQEALQYPSLNVRHIETSWKGPGLKTIIPEKVTAHIDVRLVAETDGAEQLEKIRKHIRKQGYLVLDREPTDEERLAHPKIATFKIRGYVNAFRTEMEAPIGQKLRAAIEEEFGDAPVSIRTMGGTVPIIPAIGTLGIPAIIVPMVNMDNNQHNPNENIRIGNISQGIRMCMVILSMQL